MGPCSPGAGAKRSPRSAAACNRSPRAGGRSGQRSLHATEQVGRLARPHVTAPRLLVGGAGGRVGPQPVQHPRGLGLRLGVQRRPIARLQPLGRAEPDPPQPSELRIRARRQVFDDQRRLGRLRELLAEQREQQAVVGARPGQRCLPAEREEQLAVRVQRSANEAARAGVERRRDRPGVRAARASAWSSGRAPGRSRRPHSARCPRCTRRDRRRPARTRRSRRRRPGPATPNCRARAGRR